MTTRLNGFLTSLVQQYAPNLLRQQMPAGDERIIYLASGLADEGVLVLHAEIPQNNYNILLKTWVDHYLRLYQLLCGKLLPSFAGINVGQMDAMRPPVILIRADSAAVIQAIAGYLVPYVAVRQRATAISDAEIIGLMTYVLTDLDADELPRKEYNQLSHQCTQIIKQLLTLPIHQYSLTVSKKPLFQQNNTQPRPASNVRAQPAPLRSQRPTKLPETGSLDQKNHPDNQQEQQKKKKAQDKTQKLPMWINFDDTKPQPPVYWNPLEDDDD